MHWHISLQKTKKGQNTALIHFIQVFVGTLSQNMNKLTLCI